MLSMKILSNFNQALCRGGVENYVSSLSKELAELDHQVKVLCASSSQKHEVNG